jgi:Domain of unknown function (DUF5615)
VKVLLDEMYDRAIAEQLRARGHDVVAVTERVDLRNASDEELLTRMAEEERVILTENAVHFMPALRRTLEAGETCFGLLISSPKSMPRSHRTVGLFVDVLERELNAHPGADALQAQMAFLSP